MHGTSPPACAHPLVRMARAIASAAMISATHPWQAGAVVTDEQFQQLVQENRALRTMIEAQQAQLDEMRRRLDGAAAPGHATATLAESAREPATPPSPRAAPDSGVILSGEAGIALLSGGSDSWYPNSEFRIDDAFVRLDAEVASDTYFFAEIELSKRSNFDTNIHPGELYVEFENISRFWGVDRLVNLRVGRTDIPFGEEYSRRDVLSNPLVVNSLSDIWGIDEGIVVHGSAGRASYAIAVQNGSSEYLADYDPDKAITLRLGFDPTSQLHLSGSAMRTGDLDAIREPFSEVWISGAVFRPISAAATTYAAELAEFDVVWTGRDTRLAANLGIARYTDDDPLVDNTRHFRFGTLEVTHELDRNWWIASRASLLHADGGYPMVGTGAFGKYFFGPLLTEELWRLTVGGGFRIGEKAVLKVDYTFERGELADGTKLTDRDQLAAQVGVGF